MKCSTTMLTILAGLAAIAIPGTSRGQGPAPRPSPPPPFDLGPGDGGATLKQPWMEAPGKSAPSPVGANIQNMWNPAVNSGPLNRADAANPFAGNVNFLGKVALPPSNPVDFNRDIELMKEHGNWVIFLIAYSGEKAPQMARKCVTELRTNNRYRLNAFVFNYGAEEKRKEFERVQKLKEKLKEEQRQALVKDGIQDAVVMPIRVRVAHFDEQTGVLISGNFRTRDEAVEAVKSIRKLEAPDPRKVDMEVVTKLDDGRANAKGPTQGFMNPFKNASVVRNPCFPKDTQTPEEQKLDMKLLRDLNVSEPYSLLKVNHAYTLVVKQFNTQAAVKLVGAQSPDQFNGFLDSLLRKEKKIDYAAKNATSLVELLRRGGCNEAYVLHTEFCSYVTVGGYDNLHDPKMAGAWTALQKGFQALANGNDPQLARIIQSLDLPTQYQPMVIPH